MSIDFENLYRNAVSRYCNRFGPDECKAKRFLNANLQQPLDKDVVEINQPAFKSVDKIKEELSQLSDDELEAKVEEFIANIEDKNIRETVAFQKEYFDRISWPSYLKIQEKEQYRRDHDYDYELIKEIDALKEREKQLVEKSDILKNATRRKKFDVCWELSNGKNGINVRDIPSPRSYLDDEEYHVLCNYFDMSSNNSALRKGNVSEKVKKETEIMDRAFTKAPELEEDVYVYRGLTSYDRGYSDYKVIKDFVDSIQKGATIKDKGYVSTATESTSDIFRQYADDALEGYGVILRIKLPKGTKAIIDTDECLLPRNSELKINNVQYIDGVRVADAEYVLPNSQE